MDIHFRQKSECTKRNPANPACPVKYIGDMERSELVRPPKAGKPLEHLTGELILAFS